MNIYEHTFESLYPQEGLLRACENKFQQAYEAQLGIGEPISMIPNPAGQAECISLDAGRDNPYGGHTRFMLCGKEIDSDGYLAQVTHGQEISVAYVLYEFALLNGDDRLVADMTMDAFKNSTKYIIDENGEVYENRERLLEDEEVDELTCAVETAELSLRQPRWIQRVKFNEV